MGLEALGEKYLKHLEGKLWEMRRTGRDGIARALYITAVGKRVVMVRAFVKKTLKAPRGEIEIALRRGEEAIARYGKPEIFNTDQGSQFTGGAFTGMLAGHGIKICMDGKVAWTQKGLGRKRGLAGQCLRRAAVAQRQI